MRVRPVLPLLLFVFVVAGAALAQEPVKPAPGNVSGTVTVDGKPALGVTVMLVQQVFGEGNAPGASATTDKDGQFHVDDVAPGKYYLYSDAPALVVEKGSDVSGATVYVGAGETVKGVNVTLRRGGVVTGRVTTADGAPVVELAVALLKFGEDGKTTPVQLYTRDPRMTYTDDRGVYRLYGIAPGTYLLAVGSASDGMSIEFGSTGKRYVRRFSPGVATEGEARRLEVAAGAEVSGIDLALAEQTATFTISGRVVDGETGEPLEGVMYGFGKVADGRFLGAFGYAGVSGENGEFRLTGFEPGSYGLLGMSRGTIASGYYTDATFVDVTSANIEGAEIRMHRGVTVSGTVVVDGATPAQTAEAIKNIGLSAGPPPSPDDVVEPSYDPTKGGWARIEPDGTFRLDGLRPGTYLLSVSPMNEGSRPAVLRIERDGAPFDVPFTIDAGEPIDDVRVVLAMGTGVLRGRVTYRASIPPRRYSTVELRRPGSNQVAKSSGVEEDGVYVVDQIPEGEYEVTVVTHLFALGDGGPSSTLRSAPRRVTIDTAGKQQADFVIGDAEGSGGAE